MLDAATGRRRLAGTKVIMTMNIDTRGETISIRAVAFFKPIARQAR